MRALLRRDRLFGQAEGRAAPRFDLDENDLPAVIRDEVDLSVCRAPAPVQYPTTGSGKMAGRDVLTEKAEGGAIHTYFFFGMYFSLRCRSVSSRRSAG